MKTKNIIIHLLLTICLSLLLTTCKQRQEQQDIAIVDVTKQYPQKEAISIQDIADVEYIVLETNNQFLCNEDAGSFAFIGNKAIVYCNFFVNESILVFDRTGKAVTRIDRKGQSEEEYTFLRQAIYDDETDELYVLAHNDIVVYDLSGKYKRRFPQTVIIDTMVIGGETCELPYLYDAIYNLSKDYLLCYRDNAGCFANIPSFLIVSKQSGEKIEDISIPCKKCIEKYVGSPEEGTIWGIYDRVRIAAKTGNGVILNEASSDTIYKLTPNLSLIPRMTRKPSIQTMKIPIFLNINMETDRYYFMTTVKREDKLPYTPLMYDKRTGEISEQNFYNADDLSKRKITVGAAANEELVAINDKQAYSSILAFQLKEAYDNGTLTGKLKEIASKLKEDDNPVLMLVRFK